jgi:hypothetical protein
MVFPTSLFFSSVTFVQNNQKSKKELISKLTEQINKEYVAEFSK